jgi:hypothetical protein
MNEPVVVDTDINYEDYKKCARFKYMKTGRHVWPAYVLMGLFILVVFYGIYFYLSLILENNSKIQYMYWINFSIVLADIPLVTFLPYLRIRSGYKKLKDRSYRYIFTENRIFAGAAGSEPDKMEQYGYWQLRRVFEMRDAFYLDVRGEEYLILPKRNMGAEAEETLRGVVAGKAGKGLAKCYREKSTKLPAGIL